jgi:hypothetical protein
VTPATTPAATTPATTPAATPTAPAESPVVTSGTPIEATETLDAFGYEVEATATVALATKRVTLNERLTITNTGTLPFASLNLLHFPRAVGAWSRERVSVDGTPVTPTYPTNLSIQVPFATPLEPGATAVIRLRGLIDLAASRDTFGRLGAKGDFLLLGNWTALPGKPVKRTTVGDPISAPPALRMTTTVVTDRALPAAAVQVSGTATTAPAGSGRLWRFTIEQARDTAIAINPAFREVRLTDPVSGVEVRGVATSTLRASALARDGRTALAAYSRWFGAAPYPLLRIVDSAMTGVSQEHPGLILIGANFTGARRVYMVNHEAAHQWWFALVANDQFRNPWVDEALADFSAYLLADSRPTSCSSRRIDGTADSYGRFMGSCSAYYETVYKRGTRMFYALADALGRETLLACLKGYADAHRFATVSDTPLVRALRDCGPAAPPILARYLSTLTP